MYDFSHMITFYIGIFLYTLPSKSLEIISRQKVKILIRIIKENTITYMYTQNLVPYLFFPTVDVSVTY